MSTFCHARTVPYREHLSACQQCGGHTGFPSSLSVSSMGVDVEHDPSYTMGAGAVEAEKPAGQVTAVGAT